MSAAAIDLPRRRTTVGFLPRLGALILDVLIIVVAVQLLMAALHYWSHGTIQGAAGLAFESCDLAPTRPVLDPPPPADYNFTVHCQRTLFGLDMANWLAVGKVVSTGDGFDKEHRQYALGPSFEQAPTDSPTVLGDGWIVFAFLFYLPMADWLFAKTFGKKLFGLRTVALRGGTQLGLPFKTALMRFLGMNAGIIVATVIVATYQLVTADFEGSATLSRWLYLLIAGWIVWNVARLIAGSDSLYDQAAGTTVVRA